MISTDGAEQLSHAIIKTTCDDYAQAYLGFRVAGKSPKSVLKECKSFFEKGTFEILSGGKINAERMMKEVLADSVDNELTTVKELLESPKTPKMTIELKLPPGESNITYRVPPIYVESVLKSLEKTLTEELKKLSEGHAPLAWRNNAV